MRDRIPCLSKTLQIPSCQIANPRRYVKYLRQTLKSSGTNFEVSRPLLRSKTTKSVIVKRGFESFASTQCGRCMCHAGLRIPKSKEKQLAFVVNKIRSQLLLPILSSSEPMRVDDVALATARDGKKLAVGRISLLEVNLGEILDPCPSLSYCTALNSHVMMHAWWHDVVQETTSEAGSSMHLLFKKVCNLEHFNFLL